MKIINLVVISGILFCLSCNGQKETSNLTWKNFDFSDSGIKISLPCDPSKTAKVFQEKPKIAKSYEIACDSDKFRFSVSLAERFENYEPDKTKDTLDEIEKFMREGVKDNASIQSRDLTVQTFPARQIDVKNESIIGRQLHIQNERGAYNIQLVLKRKPNQSSDNMNAEFESVAKEYFNSLKISDYK